MSKSADEKNLLEDELLEGTDQTDLERREFILDEELNDEDQETLSTPEAVTADLQLAEDEDMVVSAPSSSEGGPSDRVETESDAGEFNGEDRTLAPKDRQLQAMRLEAKVEAVIFAAQKPLKATEIHELMADETISLDDVQMTVDQLVEHYEGRSGGFKLHYVKRMGYQFQTCRDAGPIMERMFSSRPRPISRAALETLSIIAYRQPVTRAEVEFIRGVDAGSIFKTLMERDLIKCVGRKDIVGRPMLFGTTDEFLKVFNLGSIKDLPPLESFQPSREMVKGAIDRIEGDDGVDVEAYIASNTGDEDVADAAPGEDGGGPNGGAGDDFHGLRDSAEDQPLTVMQESGQTTTAKDSSDVRGAPPKSGDVADAPASGLLQGARASDEAAPERALEDDSGDHADSEMAVPTGDILPEGGGELDR